MNTKCYLCESSENKTVFIENGIPIVQCKTCGHVFSTYKQDEHYQGYWGEEEGYDLEWWDVAHRDVYSEFIESFLKAEKGKILDVGCGLGFFVKTVLEKRPGWEAFGYEMSPSAVKYAKEKNSLKNIFSGQVEKSKIPKNSFDIITLWDVIEHIPKPQPIMKYLYSILKPGGILFLQTPNFPIQLFKAKLKVMINGMKPDGHYLEVKDHINDYTETTLAMLSKDSGFQSIKFKILKPILFISGGKSKLGGIAKLLYYKISKFLWVISFKKINLNNTLFAILKK
ncbi:MAG: class I SAM-dependent methyltransferase [Leptospiraceae bacterium]|nr:methyltransferase domain-containing protein [Leptospiraceae bacterium]MCK6380017.1 class I SAM-dependent methyltransferase [Leptospiraceae bacterium]NUM40320.1 methyltransferase domain-containing protein [Leptospiraceae bacterium]